MRCPNCKRDGCPNAQRNGLLNLLGAGSVECETYRIIFPLPVASPQEVSDATQDWPHDLFARFRSAYGKALAVSEQDERNARLQAAYNYARSRYGGAVDPEPSRTVEDLTKRYGNAWRPPPPTSPSSVIPDYSEIRQSLRWDPKLKGYVDPRDTPTVTATPDDEGTFSYTIPVTTSDSVPKGYAFVATPGSTYSFTIGDEKIHGPWTERDIFPKLPQDDLTGRSETDTLDLQPDNPEEGTSMAKPVMSREAATALMRQAGEALAELDRLEKKFSKDLGDGSVIAFDVTFTDGGTAYYYAAVRANGGWWPTGDLAAVRANGQKMYPWADVLVELERLNAQNFEVLRRVEPVPMISNGETTENTPSAQVVHGVVVTGGKHERRIRQDPTDPDLDIRDEDSPGV